MQDTLFKADSIRKKTGIHMTPKGAPVTPAASRMLPEGRVEAVLLVDPKEPLGGNRWRYSFDLEAYTKDTQRSDRQWRFRVGHVLTVLDGVLRELGKAQVRAVFLGKTRDDLIEIGIWRAPNVPPVILEVAGWRVSHFFIDWGRQCAKGFDPGLAEITNVRRFLE